MDDAFFGREQRLAGISVKLAKKRFKRCKQAVLASGRAGCKKELRGGADEFALVRCPCRI